jgi:hypothetical protein
MVISDYTTICYNIHYSFKQSEDRYEQTRSNTEVIILTTKSDLPK